MEWTDADLEELAAFLAKRMRPDLSLLCADDAPSPGDPVSAWRDALRAARDGGTLGRLMARAAAVAPHDENLQQACGLLADPVAPRPLRAMFAAAMVGFVVVLGGGAAVAGAATRFGTLGEAEAPGDTVTVAPAAARPVAVASPAAAPLADEPVADEVAGVDADVEPAATVVVDGTDAEASVADPVVASPAPTVPASGAGVALSDNRCSGEPGEVVGYWYAGEAAPGRQGELLTMTQAVNVRATYPDENNRFDKRSRVRCVLSEGDRIVLAQAPIRVPGGHYWVPLVAGPKGT